MTARVVVLTPWRDDGPDGHRTRLYAACKPHIKALGYQVIEGDSLHTPFSLGNTYNSLARAADIDGRWDAIVLHEADYYVPPEQIHAAVAAVLDGHPGQAYAYDENRKMKEGATERFLAGHLGPWVREDYHRGRNRIGGPRVIGRALWDTIGGYDERFVGWGYEDNALRDMAWMVHPHLRIPGPLLNLWHPKHIGGDPYWQQRAANKALWQSIREGLG